MHRVLIVDDSATARLALRSAIERDPELYVVGEADCGAEALALARRHRPAVITMDVVMRRESGIDVAAAIMAEAPCPIVIVTACDTSDPNLAYRALQVGALELVSKLPSPHAANYAERATALTRLLRNMARVPVVHRVQRPAVAPNLQVRPTPAPAATGAYPRLIVVGASTGGPICVRELLAALPKKLPIGIAVAQHITRGFGKGFASWLTDATGKRCLYVEKRTSIEPGTVYIAPDDADMIVDRLLYVAPQPAGSAYSVPNVDVLFQSAAAALGPAVLSVLMTGMGDDGAAGTAALARVGATTFVQDPKTCAVSSMPESAIRAASVSAVLEPAMIPSAIERALRDSPAPKT